MTSFVDYLNKHFDCTDSIVTGPLNAVELATATLTVVRFVQQEEFLEAIKRLVNVSLSEFSDRLMTDKNFAKCFVLLTALEVKPI